MSVMVDWLTLRVPMRHASFIQGGRLVRLNRDESAIEWDSHAWDSIKGSHDSNVVVRSSSGSLTHLDISGNAVKFFQGHNVFGTGNLPGLAKAFVFEVARRLSLPIVAEDLAQISVGDVEVRRVDLNQGYVLASRAEVMAAIRALDNGGRMAHRGRGTLKGDSTIYFGESSTYYGFKFYAKGAELEAPGHKLADAFRGGPVEQYADCLLRGEVMLRSRELQRKGLDRVAAWSENGASEVFAGYVDRVRVSEEVELSAMTRDGLPARLQGVYALWKGGTDLRTIYTRPTFYRYRAELLKHGIDIAVQQQRDASSTRPQLRLVLNANQASIPEWAVGTSYFFEPAQVPLAA